MAIKLFDCIIGPRVTTKSFRFNKETRPKIVVNVHVDANKILIKKAIKEFFGSEPVAVNVIVSKGKTKRSKNGRKYVTKLTKKAIVTFPAGFDLSKISEDGHEMVQSEGKE